MDIDVAPKRVHGPPPIAARFQTREPEYAGENPVPLRVLPRELLLVDLTSRSASHEHGSLRATGPDTNAHPVQAARRTTAVLLLTGSIAARGDEIAPEHTALSHVIEDLRGEIHPDVRTSGEHSLTSNTEFADFRFYSTTMCKDFEIDVFLSHNSEGTPAVELIAGLANLVQSAGEDEFALVLKGLSRAG